MKNGKLFGKLNIIDLLIILIVLAALVFVGLRYLRPAENNAYSAPQEKVRLTFLADTAPIVLMGQERQVGSPVTDYDTSNYLGVLSSYVAETAYTNGLNSTTGEIVPIPSVTACYLTFACEGEGHISEDALYVNGVRYYIGATYVICAGQTRISCRLADFERID